jgi:Terminase RNaseH-like domain/Terminase large subunit, T4likevirus-type, N-terminal
MAKKIYLGNPLLKAAGVSVPFTKENIEEYLRCSENYIYFIEKYCKIVTLDYGLQPFNLYDCQKEKLNIIHNNRKVILMEPRQQGKTTTSAAYILWYTLFQGSKTVAILANKATAAREVLARYQLMYEHLPQWLQQGVKTWNKGDIALENGSIVFTAATSRQGIRGKSVNLLYVDETAIIPNNIAEEFFTAVSPTISAGSTTKILLSSTPLGYNHFWKFWNDAENKRNDFIPLFIPYWKIPGRDEKWAEEQRRQLGKLKFNQEILCAFLGSSLTLIDADSIAQMSPNNPIHSKDGLDIYDKVERDHSYVLVADVAKGVGGDYSAFTILDVTEMPYRQVGKFRDNTISPLLYPSMIYKVAKEYNNAWVLIEINTSEQVAEILHSEYEYENIIFVNRTPQGQVVSGGFGGGKTQLGVNTDKKVKRIGCMNFKSLVEGKKMLIQDADTIAEISTFIERKNSYSADEGYHDDLVMPLVLFSWLTTNPYFKELTNTNIRKELYEQRMKAIEDEVTPFGIIDDGREETQIVDAGGQVWQIEDRMEKSEKNFFMNL